MSLPTPYDVLGGEPGVRELVERFYDYMDQLPEAAGIRRLHARSLRSSREKLALFLSGWLGGPDLYSARHGHPRLRQRHLPFPIGSAERDQWMLCMTRALDDLHLPKATHDQLLQAFWKTADHMRNKPDYDSSPLPVLTISGRPRQD